MQERYSNAWEATMRRIEDEVSPIIFETWYRDIVPVEFTDGTYIVEIANEMVLDGMNKKGFDAMIKRNLILSLGETVDVIFMDSTNAKLFKDKFDAQASVAASERERIVPLLEVLDGHRLQPNYTFENFVVGKNNEHSRAFCKAIADDMTKDLNCAKNINPLFIYGNSGLGKTHLLNAIAYQILQAHPEAQIMFTTCENFTNEYIASINSGQNASFRNKYRNVDILLIDDIQFLTGKEGTQEEFFHTFEQLRNNNRQIIITSDKLPRDIPDLEERLVTRFEGGILSDIQVPNLETRIAILMKKAEMENADVDNTVLEYIANNVDVNIRTLQGALQTLITTAKITNQPITIDLAETVIKNRVTQEKQITEELIITKVCEFYGLSRDKMMGTSRKKEVLLPRQVTMYFCRNLMEMSLPGIGKLFKKDHSTVANAIDKIEEGLKSDPMLQADIRAIKNNIKS